MAKDKKAENETKNPVKAEKVSKKADKKKKSNQNPFKAIASFFKSVNSERKKVVWPTAKETFKNALIVIVVTFIVGVAIYGVDSLLSLGLKGVKNLAATTTVVTEADENDADNDIVEDTTDTTAEDTTAETTENTTAAE